MQLVLCVVMMLAIHLSPFFDSHAMQCESM